MLRWKDVFNYLDPNDLLEKIMELWLSVLEKHVPLKLKFTEVAQKTEILQGMLSDGEGKRQS